MSEPAAVINWLSLISLAIYGGALVAGFWLAYAVWRRRRAQSGPLPAGAPLGSRVACRIETSVIALVGLLLVVLVVRQWFPSVPPGWLQTRSQSLAPYSMAAMGLVVAGYLAALLFAWRGAGSVAVVVLAAAMFAGVILRNIADSRSWPRHASGIEAHPQHDDVQLVIDIEGANVSGAELWANDVHLGQTPVQIMLSDFLSKVPDWKEPPGPPRTRSTSDGGSSDTSSLIPEDPQWGRFPLPDFRLARLPQRLTDELNQREGKYTYVRVELNGEPGQSGGGSSGGGVAEYSIWVRFRFPQREAAVERLLEQARLVDYQVSDAWLTAAAEFGPDAWVAIRQAAVDEPEMMVVFDAWVRREYRVDDMRAFDSAWEALERIMHEADAAGSYVTASPAGRAVELLSPRLSGWELAEAATPMVRTTTHASVSAFANLFGEQHAAVYADGARRLWLRSGGARGWGGIWGGGQQLEPSGLVLAHAIWLVHQRLASDKENVDVPNVFQAHLVSELIRGHADHNNSPGMTAATRLGGPVVERYLLRKVAATRDVDVRFSFADQVGGVAGSSINRWVYLAAQLPGPVGRRFRSQNQDELFSIADQIAKHFHMRDDVAGELPFLFLDNDRGAEGIGVKYWPRFSDVLRREQSFWELQTLISYLIALEPAATVEMYVRATQHAWENRVNETEIVEQLKRLEALPPAKRAEVLDRLLPFFRSAAEEGDQHRHRTDWLQRSLQALRYDEIDDEVSVAHHMARLTNNFADEANPSWERQQFEQTFLQTAARRPLLVEAMATAEDAEIRLLTIDALREHPIPRNRQLLATLHQDEDDRVQNAAGAVAQHWDELRATMPE